MKMSCPYGRRRSTRNGPPRCAGGRTEDQCLCIQRTDWRGMRYGVAWLSGVPFAIIALWWIVEQLGW